VDFIERLDEVGLLSYLSSIFVYIAYLRLELISTVVFFCCGLPLAIKRFSSYNATKAMVCKKRLVFTRS
jgi:hypothetical protein